MYVYKEAVFTGPAMKSESIDKHIDLNFPIDLIFFSLSTFICMKFYVRPEGNGSVECCTNYYYNGNACTGMMIIFLVIVNVVHCIEL